MRPDIPTTEIPPEAGPVEATLRKAMALIADEGRWCKGTMARTAVGVPAGTNNPAAARWCAFGALQNVGGLDRGWPEPEAALREAAQFVDSPSPVVINDHLGHPSVMAMYVRAIKRAQEMGV